MSGTVRVVCQSCPATGEATPTSRKTWSVAWPNHTQRWRFPNLPAWCPPCAEAHRQEVIADAKAVQARRGRT